MTRELVKFAGPHHAPDVRGTLLSKIDVSSSTHKTMAPSSSLPSTVVSGATANKEAEGSCAPAAAVLFPWDVCACGEDLLVVTMHGGKRTTAFIAVMKEDGRLLSTLHEPWFQEPNMLCKVP